MEMNRSREKGDDGGNVGGTGRRSRGQNKNKNEHARIDKESKAPRGPRLTCIRNSTGIVTGNGEEEQEAKEIVTFRSVPRRLLVDFERDKRRRRRRELRHSEADKSDSESESETESETKETWKEREIRVRGG